MCEYSGCVTPLTNECSNHHHAWFGSDNDLCTVPRYSPKHTYLSHLHPQKKTFHLILRGQKRRSWMVHSSSVNN